jgi:hypothetical protein
MTHQFVPTYRPLTREHAVDIVGEEIIKKVESENCDFSGRSLRDWETEQEFKAAVPVVIDGYKYHVVMYYFVDREEVARAEELENLDWENCRKHYQIED